MKKLFISFTIACFTMASSFAQPLTALAGKPDSAKMSLSAKKVAEMAMRVENNTVSGYLQVSLKNIPQQSTFSLYDKSGREVISTSLQPGNNTLALSELPNGCYVANVLSSNGTFLYSTKIMVN